MKVIGARLRCERCKVQWDGLLQMTFRQVGSVEVVQWEPIALDRHCPECAMGVVCVVETRKEPVEYEQEGI